MPSGKVPTFVLTGTCRVWPGSARRRPTARAIQRTPARARKRASVHRMQRTPGRPSAHSRPARKTGLAEPERRDLRRRRDRPGATRRAPLEELRRPPPGSPTASRAPRSAPAAPVRWAGRACTSPSSCAACAAPRADRTPCARSRRSARASGRAARRAPSRAAARPARRSAICRKIHGFFIVARPHMTASQPVSRNIATASSAGLDVAVADDGDRERALQLRDARPVGAARVHLARGASVQRDRRDALALADAPELEEVLPRRRRARGET